MRFLPLVAIALFLGGCVSGDPQLAASEPAAPSVPVLAATNQTQVFFFSADGSLSKAPPSGRNAQERSFKAYPLGVGADWARAFENATSLSAVNATLWVRLSNPAFVHPLFTPWPCGWSMGLAHSPFQNGDRLDSSNCSNEPLGVAQPGVYRFSFQFDHLGASPFDVDLDRSLRISLGAAILGPPELSGVKVLVGSTEFPSQIWMTGLARAPE